MLKVLDACQSSFNRYWVFAAGLTDVAVNLRVYCDIGARHPGQNWMRFGVSCLRRSYAPICSKTDQQVTIC